MFKLKPLKEEINGFKVIKDLGPCGNGTRYAVVICKACKNEFTTCVYHINRLKSCGCLPIRIAKTLPEYINGFKILKDFGYINRQRKCLAICKECKCEYEVDPNVLKKRKNCGCKQGNTIVNRYIKDYPRLGRIYNGMLLRCYNKNDPAYSYYGEKGIKICDEWKNDRNIFMQWALKNGYEEHLSIDRIDGRKGYYPENCRWATASIQVRNTVENTITLEEADKIKENKDLYEKILNDSKNAEFLLPIASKYKISFKVIRYLVTGKLGNWED